MHETEELVINTGPILALKLTGSIGILIRAKKSGFDFLMEEALQRMQDQGIYLSQKVINFALGQVNEI